MPAKKKPAPKAPAKPAKKAAAKPAAKKPVKAAKPAPKAPVKPVKKAAPAKKTAPVKKPAPAKKAPAPKKPAPPAKKPAAPVKKAPAAKKPAAPAKKAAPVKKPAPPAKPAPAKKAAAPAAKPAPKPAPAVKAAAPAKPAPAPVKKAAPAPAPKKPATTQPKITNVRRTRSIEDEGITLEVAPKKPVLPAAFLKKQRARLVELRDAYLSSAEGVASESLRNSEGNESAFGMHQADAGSDAYDRDFALSLLAKEQDAIYEINEALKRIDSGTYGICEMSGDLIPEERLEALPFTRFTVACQERIEREQRGGRWNRPVRSLFGLDEAADDSDDERDEDETPGSSSNNNESLDFGKE